LRISESISSSRLSSGSSETAYDPGIKKCKLSSWLKETIELQLSSSIPQNPEQKMKKELQDYLQLPQLDAELDPLQWWKVHMIVLPTMANLA